jgi:hypothetical protein
MEETANDDITSSHATWQGFRILPMLTSDLDAELQSPPAD